MTVLAAEIMGLADWLTKTINYEIIKEVLAGVQEVNTDAEKPPRVYFSDFNDWSLNIYMSYWVKPADYWLFQQVNFEIMRRFKAEQIEFAFPSQTLFT